ncbi:hypothetical protein [Streptomyces narbonensis]|uniref:hypothetical protein n=1 Tax=Streptomyces narbonensis TaxID=67333 RepID=UPI0016780433|nr:hypothetical protein [Streptomyces narbonensis]GGV96654.1 hypothetical protein GCM10010230_15350 [Streptomyces narbonensis]
MADQQDGGEREPQPIDEEAAWAAIVAGYGDEPADPPGTRPFRPIETLSLPEPEDEDEDAQPDTRTGPGPATTSGTGTGSGTSTGSGTGTGSASASGSGDASRSEAAGSGAETAPSGDESGATGPTGADGEPPADPDRRPEAGAEKPALGSSIVFAPGVRPSGPRDYSPAEPEDGPDGAEEGHFVPPEPPPLPEADATTKFAWLGVVGGPVLMLAAVLFQWDMTWWLTTLCVGGFLGGFATLVARMKHDDDDDDGFGDPGRGAVV